MPYSDRGQYYAVADKQTIIDFANALRAAGQADPIADLFPSHRFDSKSCLIANALNFSCHVEPYVATTGLVIHSENGMRRWIMSLPSNMTADRAHALASAVNCPLITNAANADFAIVLPEDIGNAAHDFDNGDAFQEYVDGR